MTALRGIVLGIVLIVAISIYMVGLVAAGQQGDALPAKGVVTTRMLAVVFLVCDVAISSALIALLVTKARRFPAWLEGRRAFSDSWVWYLLIALAVLCYASLAPTFLFLYLRMRQ